MIVKICGITNIEEAEMVIDAGANAIGFLVGIEYRAEDKLSFKKAKEIIASVGNRITKVMVTHLQKPKLIVRYFKYIGADLIQLHNDMEIEDILYIRQHLKGVRLIKAIHVENEEAIKKALLFMDYVDYLLLDTRTKDRLGGTGITHNRDIDAKIVKLSKIPVIIAGGLNPDNVYDAVQKVKPFGVDVNSGVEDKYGKKDLNKIKKFVNNAHK